MTATNNVRLGTLGRQAAGMRRAQVHADFTHGVHDLGMHRVARLRPC